MPGPAPSPLVAALACLGLVGAPAVVADDARPAIAPLAQVADLGDFEPAQATALRRGDVVRLDVVASAAGRFHTRVAAVAHASPGQVVRALRNYDRLESLFPEFRDLSSELGPAADRFTFRFKVHPLFPAIRLGKRVTWDFDAKGDAVVRIELTSCSTKRVTGQSWTFRATSLGGGRCLLTYETLDDYVNAPMPQRLLQRLAGISERLVADVRDRCEAPAATGL